ncbi:hypothetical protein [Virgibacillus sp. L01]|uniref:hypothetical protein n=1 Tax=Virgibacillus sp. L01 TaxID=3457429 RepID=UPI003FD383F9
MLEDYPVKNYGLNDLATSQYIKKFAEDLTNGEITDGIFNIINSDIENIDGFEVLLKIKVLIEYKEFIPYLNSSSIINSLNQFYDLASSKGNLENKIKGKIIKYINHNPTEIFSFSDVYVQDESLDIATKNSGGIRVWGQIIELADRFMLFSRYDELYQILHKKYNDNLITLTRIILSPVTFMDYDSQIEIALRIKKRYPEIYKGFQTELSSLIKSNFFENQSPFEKVKLMRDVLGSRILGIKGELLIKDKLTGEEEKLENNLESQGISHVISSEEYAKNEVKRDNFKDKFYELTYIDVLSRYKIMQYEDKNSQSIMDLMSNMNGINHEKYGKASFAFKFKNMTTENILNTMYLIKNYDEKFWRELAKISDEITNFTGISDFLTNDINRLKKLVLDNEFFIACSFISQLIERLLRELFLKLMYGESGIFKEANFTLGNLLNFNVKSDINKLLLLFSKEEMETMDYYLTNKEYGWNLRNRLAHYNISMDELSMENCSCLLHFLIFILIKIEYEGTVFDEEKPSLN